MESKVNVITAEQLAGIIHRRLGLIVGPGITLGDGSVRRVQRRVWAKLTGEPESADPGTFTDLVQGGHKPAIIREAIEAAIASEPDNSKFTGIASMRWAAILSTSIDNRFELQLQRWADNHPTRPNVSVVSDLRSRFVPGRSLPIYKVLGSVVTGEYAVTAVDQRIRLSVLPRVIKTFADYVQGAGVLCLGLGEDPMLMAELFAPILADPTSSPGPLFFLANDPAASSEVLKELELGGLRVQRVQGDLSLILKRVTDEAKTAYTGMLPFSNIAKTLAEQVQVFGDLAVLVPSGSVQGDTGEKQMNRLRELLFSPAIPNWEPFAANLDFRRTIASTITTVVRDAMTSAAWGDVEIRVDGASSVGKTTILKRVAFDLASMGTVVIWLRHYTFQDGPSVLRQFCKVVQSQKKIKQLVVFADDPLGLGTIRLEDVRSAFKSGDIKVVLVTGVRSADLATNDQELDLGEDYATGTITVPDTFDDAEWNSLPAYLVRLGVNKDLAEATASVTSTPGRVARDVLSTLYYLLPETQAKITKSVREEYRRLGDRNALRQVIIGELNASADLLKRAYEMVAVATKYCAPLPMEVLVSALEINYDEWLATSEGIGLTFGLFYQEVSDQSQTVVYRTRNDLVSDIIVTTLNGGIGVRGGELNCMRILLAACNGVAPAYRDFCLRVLVPARDATAAKPPIVRLEHAERLSLFDAAIAALPAEDPTLLHHLGLWQGKAGDTATARSTLDRALKARPYPYSSRGEASEHIHTSHAANELRAIQNGQIDAEQGKMNALHHLERASSPTFFNPNAIHQKALLVAQLADLSASASGTEDADWFNMIGWALSDLDRAILQLSSDYATEADKQNVAMLEHARDQVLDRIIHLGDAVDAAERLWQNFSSQDGFTVVARRLFGVAQKQGQNAGTEFKKAFDYCEECLHRVLLAGAQPAVSLLEVTLHIYFRWQVRRRTISEGTSEIRWEYIQSLAQQLVKSPRSLDQPFYHYLTALALSHSGRWAEASNIFQDLRKRQISPPMLHEPRDFLMNPNGGMRKVQGVITSAAFERFFRVDEFRTDFRTARVGTWPNDGEIFHAYIRFSFAGPLAVDEP